MRDRTDGWDNNEFRAMNLIDTENIYLVDEKGIIPLFYCNPISRMGR